MTLLLTGELLDGRYRLVERCGVGGTSEVFRAHDETLGRDVAIKRFAEVVDELSDEGRRRAEVRLLAGLAHPGVVTLFDAVLAADPPYLVMEYVDGPSLRDRLRAGPLTEADAEEIGAAVASGLAAIHDRGVVHRDVKPENILLPTARAVSAAKLVDFGIAKAADSATVTAVGTVLGTAAYLSPEQARGEPAGPASDVYSLGLVLIEALSGEKPFPGTALESAAARLQQDPDLSAPALAGLRGLLAEMTRRDPAARPSATEVAVALRGDVRTRVLTPAPASTEPLPVPSTTAPMPVPGPTAPAAVADVPDPVPSDRRGGFRRGALLGLVVLVAAAAITGIGFLATSWAPTSTGPERTTLLEKTITEPVEEPAPVQEPAPADEPGPPPNPGNGNGNNGNGNNGNGNGNNGNGNGNRG